MYQLNSDYNTIALKVVFFFVYLYFYDKHAYFFHSECADSSEPQWEHKLFLWNFEYQNTYSN